MYLNLFNFQKFFSNEFPGTITLEVIVGSGKNYLIWKDQTLNFNIVMNYVIVTGQIPQIWTKITLNAKIMIYLIFSVTYFRRP